VCLSPYGALIEWGRPKTDDMATSRLNESKPRVLLDDASANYYAPLATLKVESIRIDNDPMTPAKIVATEGGDDPEWDLRATCDWYAASDALPRSVAIVLRPGQRPDLDRLG
jgi:hypothetical protein